MLIEPPMDSIADPLILILLMVFPSQNIVPSPWVFNSKSWETLTAWKKAVVIHRAVLRSFSSFLHY